MRYDGCMYTLIKNALVVPMTRENHYLEKADIGINGTHIDFVGKTSENVRADRVIDATGMIAMPSLVNAHTHVAMELERNYKDDLPTLEAWLGEIFPIEAKLTEGDILWANRLGMVELIQSGCTLFNDMYYQVHCGARAANEAGIRAVIGFTGVGDVPDLKRTLDREGPLVQREVEKSDGRIKVACAPHAVYTCTPALYRYAHDWAKEHGALLHTHMAETTTEVSTCKERYGASPFRHLEKLGYFKDTRHILAHCVHLTDDEMDTLKDLDATVCTNPTSNAKLASGMAPIGKMLKKGVKVALGTDGSSSNNNIDMVEEMHVASLISSSLTGDITSLTPYQILKMATIDGAKALGFDYIGTLQSGKEADLILIDTRKPHLTPLNNPFSALVFAVQASDVDTVFCQGRMLMEHRRMLTLDPQPIMEEVNAHWKALLERSRS